MLMVFVDITVKSTDKYKKLLQVVNTNKIILDLLKNNIFHIYTCIILIQKFNKIFG